VWCDPPIAPRTPRPAAVTPKGADRRARILRALEDLLEEQPFGEIRIGQITARANVTRPGFYFYFPTKAAAVAALLEELLEATLAMATAWYAGEPDDPLGALRDGMVGTVELWREHARLFRAMTEAARTDGEVGALWAAWSSAFVERVTVRIVEDRARGEIVAGPDPDALAEALVGSAFFLMERDVVAVLEGRTRPVDDLVDALVHLFSSALYGRPAGGGA